MTNTNTPRLSDEEYSRLKKELERLSWAKYQSDYKARKKAKEGAA